jgi:AcrR family transcriptional regulator
MSNLSKKQEDILVTGRELFWKHGIRRVSVEEICKKAVVSKMTFYKYFSNKNDLVKEIMRWIMEDALTKFDEVLARDTHYREKAKEMLVLKMEGTANISKEFMSDYYSLNEPHLIEFLHSMTNEVLNRFLESIKTAQEKGEVRSEIKPEFIMYFFNHMQTMAGDQELLKFYPVAQDLIMEILNFFFYGILSDKE